MYLLLIFSKIDFILNNYDSFIKNVLVFKLEY